MADFSRELNTDIQVEQFVDGILCLSLIHISEPTRP